MAEYPDDQHGDVRLLLQAEEEFGIARGELLKSLIHDFLPAWARQMRERRAILDPLLERQAADRDGIGRSVSVERTDGAR